MPTTITRTNADYDMLQVPEEPMIGLAMPFQPTAQSKNEIRHTINSVLGNIKSGLETIYSEDTILRTMIKLERLVNNLYYGTGKKSVVISLAPGTERVIYLNHPVATKLLINEQFYLGDLIENKQIASQLLFLILTRCWAKLYHFENQILQRVSFDRAEYHQPRLFSDPGLSESQDRAVIGNENKLFKTVNCNLSFFYQNTFCPLIIAGNTDTIKEFTSVTPHKHHIVDAVSTDKNWTGDAAILELLKPATSRGSRVRQRYLLNIIHNAHRSNNLLSGKANVEQASKKGENYLMVIDKEQIHIKRNGSYSDNTTNDLTRLDTMIEKLLKSNGHIEIIEKGMPTAYGGVVLLKREKYPPPIWLSQGSNDKRNLL